MNTTLKDRIDRILDGARSRYDELLSGARQTTASAARRVDQGKKPLQKATSLGLKLNAIGHRTANNALKQNKKFLAHQIDALSDRLHTAAAAQSLPELVRGQFRLIPENARSLGQDARDTVDIVIKARDEIRELFAETVREFRGVAPATPKQAVRRKTAKKSKRVSARKPTKKTTRTKPAAVASTV